MSSHIEQAKEIYTLLTEDPEFTDNFNYLIKQNLLLTPMWNWSPKHKFFLSNQKIHVVQFLDHWLGSFGRPVDSRLIARNLISNMAVTVAMSQYFNTLPVYKIVSASNKMHKVVLTNIEYDEYYDRYALYFQDDEQKEMSLCIELVAEPNIFKDKDILLNRPLEDFTKAIFGNDFWTSVNVSGLTFIDAMKQNLIKQRLTEIYE